MNLNILLRLWPKDCNLNKQAFGNATGDISKWTKGIIEDKLFTKTALCVVNEK